MMVVTMLHNNIIMAAPLPRNEPGVLFLPDNAIVMGNLCATNLTFFLYIY